MGRYSKLKKNVSVIFIGNFSTKVLSFVFVRFYTSVLSTAEYGISELIATTVSLLYPVFSVMINEAMMRMLLEKNSDNKSYFSVSIKINAIGLIIFLVLSPALFFVRTLSSYYVLFILYYLSYATHGFMICFARGVERITTTAIAGVISTLTIIFCNIVLLLIVKLGVAGYLLSTIIGTSVSSLYIAYKINPWSFWEKEKFSRQKFIVKEMLMYSIPLIPNTISWWISNSSDRYFVTGICGAAENGIYSVAYKIPTILTTVYSIFISAWRISAVENFGSEESVSFYSTVYKKIGSLLFVVAGALLLFNKYFASLLYAKDFYSAYVYAPMLVMAALYSGISEFYGTIYTSNKSTIPLFLTSLLGAVLNIILNAILIPLGYRYGFKALGATVATLFSYIVICVIRALNTKKIMPIKQSFNSELLSHVLLLALMAVAVFLPNSMLIACFIFLIIVILNFRELSDVFFRVIKRE